MRTSDGQRFRTYVKVEMVNDSLGLVLGWGIICKIDGRDYYDVQGDHIPEDSMLEAAAEFMLNSRVAKEMHTGDQRGSVVFCYPLTEEIAEACGIKSQKSGLLVGIKPDPKMLAKFRSGELTGFSIGGIRIEDEEVGG